MTLRDLRKERGWTQLDLAVKLGVTPSTVYNWERGQHELSALRLRQLAELFGVAMEAIILPREEPHDA